MEDWLAIMPNTNHNVLSESPPAQAPLSDWLPLARSTPMLSKPMHMKFIKSHKDRDWFLCLAWAMDEHKDDQTQSRMLAKIYLLLRDYLPRGLTGKFAHIHGNDVVDHLLCHVGEHAMSRHKATRDADVAFTALEQWMKKGRNFTEAIQSARNERGEDGSQKRRSWKAPGLYSPAGMLALLAIAYPDNKFKDRIGRLQIDWMMTSPRDTLQVQHGFWKGVDKDNIYDIFQPEEYRRAAATFLADYTRILGRDFMRCRKDIRPFVQPWAAAKIMLEDEPLDIEDDSDGDMPGDVEIQGDVEILCKLLGPPDITKTPDELRDWLFIKARQSGTILSMWCKFWAERMRLAENHDEELIIRSLFLISLQRLVNMTEIPRWSSEAYMLLDMGDNGWLPQSCSEGGLQEARRRLSNVPAFLDLAAANTQMMEGANGAPVANEKLRRIFETQTDFICGLLIDPVCTTHAIDIMALIKLRTQVALRGVMSGDKIAQSNTTPRLSISTDRRSELLSAQTVRMLNLSAWQLQLIVLSTTDLCYILTKCQCHFYLRKFRLDEAEANPVEIPSYRLTKLLALGHGQADEEERLHTLFGYPHEALERSPSSYPLELNRLDSHESNSFRDSLPNAPTIASTTSRATSIHDTSVSIHSLAHAASPQVSLGNLGHDSSRWSSNNISHSTSIGHADNPFVGKKTAKRPATPGGRDTKRLKLEDAIKGDWLSELKANGQQLKDELNKTVKDDLKREIEVALKIQTENIKTYIHELQSQVDGLKSQTEQLRRDLTVQRKADLDTMKETLCSGLEGIKTAQTSNSELLDDLRRQLNKNPELGDKGYLALHCKCPGRSASQYEARLTRAAWHYIALIGSPDDGVDEDGEAWEQTMALFHDIPKEHFLMALQHVHIQAYQCPFSQRPTK
ncbi:hypothetical protein F5Y12DRAFT_38940 [Xylaria sp. FL1777]|nr:hypothetical protein F5Y12DRAFT_38940 [Xylaria sp. FL1777]